jgi:TRAP-type mannitol/chloroaromatic compound transport system permease large subunit
MSNETLLAIPFFTFMGIVLERSGMAEDLLDTIGQLFGPIRGGLAYAVILVGALLAATTGVVAASVIAMGLISLPIMLRYGYDRRVASGVIAASGTLAQIIPPSLVLIVLADQLGRSVGDMYRRADPRPRADRPLHGYILLMSIVRPKSMPALPLEARTLGHGVTSLIVALVCVAASPTAPMSGCRRRRAPMPTSSAPRSASSSSTSLALLDRSMGFNMMSRLAQQVIIVLIPPLALIFLVLGTIFLGIATPTEGGAMGAVGALIMAAAKGRLSLDVIKQALASTTRLSAFVMFILIGARVFSLTFYGVNGHLWVEHLLTSLPGGEVGFLIVVNILVFLLAFFLDFFELAFIIVPLLAPAADALGIDLIWFGVLLGVNMQTSFMHPPFGFALFYLRSVAARVPYLDRITGKQIAAGDHRPDLLGRGAVRLHPGHHGGARHRLPADGDALQGQGGRSGRRSRSRCRRSALPETSAGRARPRPPPPGTRCRRTDLVPPAQSGAPAHLGAAAQLRATRHRRNAAAGSNDLSKPPSFN